MTRIIAGAAGGRSIATPRGAGTRPTSDRVREAMFSRIAALLDLEGAGVLDLYAGSGALGLEALSRGAERLLAVEKHRPTAALIGRNATALGMQQRTTVRNASVARVLSESAEASYDLVLADPPYPLTEADLELVLRQLVNGGWLADDALVVVERCARSAEPSWPDGLAPASARRYGETAVHFAWAAPDRHAADD